MPSWLIVGLCCFKLISSAAAEPSEMAIASAHPLATQAGFEILAHGGNAFDAAVAVSAALAVVEPFGSGLGGGGFWLLHRAADGKDIMLDGRERAPLAASASMYLDGEGQLVPGSTINGPLAAGIPGVPAALDWLAKNYGKLPLQVSLKPAIRYAEGGFRVGPRYVRLSAFRRDSLRQSPSAETIFLTEGMPLRVNDRLKQPQLAATLTSLGKHGKQGFYTGDVAAKLVSGVRAAGGIWTVRDLAEYRVQVREPVRGHYKGISIVSASPPSSGGIVLLQALNILSAYPLDKVDQITRKHIVAEAMRRAYFDRARYLGDPDFVTIPLQRLLSDEYAAAKRSSLRLDRVTRSETFGTIRQKVGEGRNTTHFSIIDNRGNRVAATLSINYPFGAAFVPPGTGVLLNDEMDDFVSHPNEPNVYGLVGAEANAIAPGKRMLSSMTPTFVDDGRRVAVLGTPGGSRIISMVLLAVLDFASGHGIDSALWVPRFHHQYQPDELQFEKGALTDDEITKLRSFGHTLAEKQRQYGNMQIVSWDRRKGRLAAASDWRGEGFARVGSFDGVSK